MGVVLYELICGQRPFSGSLMEVIQKVLKREPPRPRDINPKVSLDLETICLKAMTKEQENRYDSCEAMSGDLRRYLADKPIEARPLTRSQHLKRWGQRSEAAERLGAVRHARERVGAVQ